MIYIADRFPTLSRLPQGLMMFTYLWHQNQKVFSHNIACWASTKPFCKNNTKIGTFFETTFSSDAKTTAASAALLRKTFHHYLASGRENLGDISFISPFFPSKNLPEFYLADWWNFQFILFWESFCRSTSPIICCQINLKSIMYLEEITGGSQICMDLLVKALS